MTDKEKELQAEAIAYYRMRITELEKACDETQELLDKQIEATYKLDKENAELKAQIEKMKSCGNCFYDCDDCNSKNKVGVSNCDKCPCGTCEKHNHWELRR